MSNLALTPSSLVVASLLTGFSLAGCNAHPIKSIEIEGASEIDTALPLDINRKVDVLVVIDNSGSMGEEQANLAANFGPFIEQLEAAGADYRISITTTSTGGPLCGAPSGGTLQLSSCLDRPQSFVFNGTDQYEVACAASCDLSDDELAVLPSAIESGGELAARPWIESFNGVSNLPDGVEPLEAFQCIAPQGISGCGWESPLEATNRALTNMQNPERPEYGFLRPDALLAVLIVTDEVDCSFNPAFQSELFDAGTFWEETASYATSAVCWNAGVECTGDSPYADCVDVDRGVDGQPTTDPSAAVLYPVERYVGALESIAAAKVDGREVLVSVIAGVPAGYNTGAVERIFADSQDPEFQQLFGIGAGCSNEVDGVLQTAIPPVRLETFASAFVPSTLPDGARNLYSVCDADYTPAILDIVAGIAGELPPACIPACVLDVDPSTAALDYSCDVVEQAGDSKRELPECEQGSDGHIVPEGVDACWIAKTGDALSEECVAQQSNLEVELLRREGVAVPSDVEVSAVCELSSLPSIDCG